MAPNLRSRKLVQLGMMKIFRCVRSDEVEPIHLLQSPVFLQPIEPIHHRVVYAVEPRVPLIKRRTASTVPTAEVWSLYARLGVLENGHDLAAGKT